MVTTPSQRYAPGGADSGGSLKQDDRQRFSAHLHSEFRASFHEGGVSGEGYTRSLSFQTIMKTVFVKDQQTHPHGEEEPVSAQHRGGSRCAEGLPTCKLSTRKSETFQSAPT